MTPSLVIADDATAVAREAAERLTQAIERAVAARGRAVIAMTGGGTARTIYEELASAAGPWRHRIDWSTLHCCWSDERHVPPSHPDSNFGMAREALLSGVAIPASHLHRMRGELEDAHQAAAGYAAELAELRAGTGEGGFLADVSLLGIGEDAHIASIFPGSSALHERERLAVAVRQPQQGTWRITMTPPALLDAETIIVAATGARKADAVAAALSAPLDAEHWPAQLLRPAGGRVTWIIDRPAAAGWRDEPRG